MDDGTGRALKCYPNCDDVTFESWSSHARFPVYRKNGSRHGMLHLCEIWTKINAVCAVETKATVLGTIYGTVNRNYSTKR